MSAIIVAGFLLGHALIHASYLAPQPQAKPGAPAWPFTLDHSWLLGPIGVDREISRVLGIGLVLVVLAAFALAAGAAIGVAPAWLWRVGVALGAVASLAVLGVYFHPWLVIGVAIDLALLWLIAGNAWAPAGIGS
jgi:hypothetical protein